MDFTRRRLLGAGAGAAGCALAGCLDAIAGENGAENGGESRRDERRQFWEEQDDFPNDDYRNREVPVFFPGGESTTPEFGFFHGKDEDIIGSEYTYDLTIRALEDPVDVWIGPKHERMGDLDDPELIFEDDSDFEYYDEYSRQSTELYEERITVPDEDDYWYYVFAAGEEPSMALVNRSFVDIEVEIEGYHYVGFDEWYEDRYGSET